VVVEGSFNTRSPTVTTARARTRGCSFQCITPSLREDEKRGWGGGENINVLLMLVVGFSLGWDEKYG